MPKVRLAVRSGIGTVLPNGDGFTDVVEWTSRVPRQHLGWSSVRYRGKRYQLHGRIRTPLFICLNTPIEKR